jgi:hypothetical protein
MSTKNLLKLHEAIAVVLLNKPDRTSTFDEIAEEINKRGLYFRKDENAVPDYQILQRATLSNGQYRHLFERVDQDKIKLRNL